MQQFLVRRLATALLVLVGVSVLTYGMLYLTPGDPATTILRNQMGGRSPPAEAVDQFRVEHGLDEPLPIQYLHWMWDVLHGDLRESYYQDASVTSLIVSRLPATLALAVAGMGISLLIALPTGVMSAVHKGGWPDYLSQFVSLLGVSMPNFWLGYLLILVFSIRLDLLPVAGTGSIDHLLLPAVTLGTGMAATVTRLVRSAMLDVLDADYVRTARSKGLTERIVVYKHALRNALIPVITIVGLQFGYLLNGAVIVEIVFQRPGLGKLLVDSVFARDYPIVQGVVLLTAVFFVTTNVAVDVAYRYIDPRISYGGEHR